MFTEKGFVHYFLKNDIYDLCNVPTWALLEELKRRKGVTYAARATGDLVGCIESAPAVALTVKLPLED